MKTIFVLMLMFGSVAVAKPNRSQIGKVKPLGSTLTLVNCTNAKNHSILNGASIQNAGYRLVYINGQLHKNWSFLFFPRYTNETRRLVKVWAPGNDPYDPQGYTDMLICDDPTPPEPPPAPAYYPDTY